MRSNNGHNGRPLVSIGIPVYNGAEHLAGAIESALMQTYEPLEIIIVDNASTDDTAAIARRFAAEDARIRYLRNRENIGSVANFRLVLQEARGTYFCWLAHDDLLAEPHAVSTVVEHLERHPDVVLCATDLTILDYDAPGSAAPQRVPEIYPERSWQEARREFFRWPQGNAIAAVHGMYRRAALVQVPITVKMHRGRLNAAYWEIPFLAALCGHGRIVALPVCLREYRAQNASEGDRIHRGSSRYDLFVLSLWARLALIRCAVQLPVPLPERLSLLGTTLGNLFRANLQRPWDPQSAITERERELAMLSAVVEERAQLIRTLRGEIEKRREIVRALGREQEVPSTSLDTTNLSHDAGASAREIVPEAFTPARPPDRRRGLGGRVRGLLAAVFQPPAAEQAKRYRTLREAVSTLHQHCAAQEGAIQQLHAEAEALLQLINAPQK